MSWSLHPSMAVKEKTKKLNYIITNHMKLYDNLKHNFAACFKNSQVLSTHEMLKFKDII
jgi:hypothetical protein